MPKCRSRHGRARRIRYRSGTATNIDLQDHSNLEAMFVSKPDLVVEHFRARGILCLLDMEMFRRLWYTNREAAERIVTVARAHGIPLERE